MCETTLAVYMFFSQKSNFVESSQANRMSTANARKTQRF